MSQLIDKQELPQWLDDLAPQWQMNVQQDQISRKYSFKDYYQTLAFVNAVAWMAHQKDHHPEMIVNYNNCVVSYSTHTARGLTALDFNCANTIDRLFEQ